MEHFSTLFKHKRRGKEKHEGKSIQNEKLKRIIEIGEENGENGQKMKNRKE